MTSRFRTHASPLIVLACGMLLSSPLPAAECHWSPRNAQAPFPYLVGGVREWPVLTAALPDGANIEFSWRDGTNLLSAAQVGEQGLTARFTPAGKLRIEARPQTALQLQLEVVLHQPGQPREKQVWEVRPAPPDRPLCYYADFGDDLIRIFMNDRTGEFALLSPDGFDQYFRRLQAHGMRRLIVWFSPFPFIAEATNYDPADWRRYEAQSRAILNSAALTKILGEQPGFGSWKWLRYLLATRLQSDVGQMLGSSAAAHGIELTVSYRPFEAALTKYYEVPSFAATGEYLGGFLPLASPTTNYHADEVGWRHYRSVLRELGHDAAGEVAAIEFPGATAADQLTDGRFRIVASPFPPLADDGFVLVRQPNGDYELQPFAPLRPSAEARWIALEGVSAEVRSDCLRVGPLQLPTGARYLIVTWEGTGPGPEFDALAPVVLRTASGLRWGRETAYWVQSDRHDPSRVAGISVRGEYWAEFQASEASQRMLAKGPPRVPLKGKQLVIDVGSEATVEMIDFNQTRARQNAIRELASILKHPGFGGIFLNTRSHVDLPVSVSDGSLGMRPAGEYWRAGVGPRAHLGLDKAYFPRSERSLAELGRLAQTSQGLEVITTWKAGEWLGESQSRGRADWRYARNLGSADGLRKLLEDLERSFPNQRLRMVVPLGESAATRLRDELEQLRDSSGKPYGRDYYARLWASNNHIPAAGEGAAMVDLRGLRVEPVFLGSGGYTPDREPFEHYVAACLEDLRENRGSQFRGPRSYFYEGQTTLRAADQNAAREARQQIIHYLLKQREDIAEVILYEAADWLYFLPLSDPHLCGHGFLDQTGR